MHENVKIKDAPLRGCCPTAHVWRDIQRDEDNDSALMNGPCAVEAGEASICHRPHERREVVDQRPGYPAEKAPELEIHTTGVNNQPRELGGLVCEYGCVGFKCLVEICHEWDCGCAGDEGLVGFKCQDPVVGELNGAYCSWV